MESFYHCKNKLNDRPYAWGDCDIITIQEKKWSGEILMSANVM
jgi:hypothetical protein